MSDRPPSSTADHLAAVERAIERAGGPLQVRFVPVTHPLSEMLLAEPVEFHGTIALAEDDGLLDMVFTKTDAPA
jgi:hypothetical protein